MQKSLIALVLSASFALPMLAMPSYAETKVDQTSSKNQLTPVQQRQAKQIQQWVMTAQDHRQDDEKRAEALRQLARYPNQNSLVAVARGLQDDNPQVREAAVVGAEPYQFAHRWRLLSVLLQDSDQHVRLAATTNLIRNYGEMDVEQQALMEAATTELIKYLKGKADQSSQLLLADIYRWHQEFDEAHHIYNTLLDSDKQNPQIWLGLADNYRAQGDDQQANKVLEQAQKALPDEANLFYSQALTLVRLDEKKQAADAIRKATQLSPDNSYFWYLNGVLQEVFNVDEATTSFEKAYEISGAPEQLYAVCDIYVRYGHLKADACLESLGKVAPAFVIDELKSKRG
ncbi:tetratricopeptide repeat protein [Photobacterium rosenbergii]|uniref:Tetratricopeptide repeat protein n=1 Tax=Photobacterium rosenbergii TaxID=294936 RepID=A0ABU3ZF35_9GAMM|nr:tetratricopeptide repeat protein [Photobacterium rosenbergii]MDV5168701.1 tetratricopeptide repeat protein [Photobacterium rosenbergii]